MWLVSWDHMAPPYITSISRNVKISRVALFRERDNFNRLLLSPSLIRKILSPSPYNKRIPVAEKKSFFLNQFLIHFFEYISESEVEERSCLKITRFNHFTVCSGPPYKK